MDAGRITAIIHTSAAKTMTIVQSPSASLPMAERSPWHSPVPYLFSGLAAMLGLIAFALLTLACSYWHLSWRLELAERDLEAGEGSENGGEDGEMKKTAKLVFEEKFLVIMAGQQKPTCLATPMCSRASSFGSASTTSTKVDDEKKKKEEESSKTSPSQVEITNMEDNSANQSYQVS